ncbi:MAG: C40 family peptidase [Muribaculaceae bacterium]|nr:C40 family peptidase [Muribaculaceae bacterium]
MKRSYHIIPITLVCTALVTLQSCGSGKRTVQPVPPLTSHVITLDELIGAGNIDNDPVPDLSERARAVVDAAHGWLGVKYRYGGEGRDGIDCSALVMNVYREALGVKLPRTSRSQHEYTTSVSRRDLQPGDLVFFSTLKNRSGISHVGLFIGNDRFIHASSSRGVVVSRLSDKYFVSHYHSSGRVPSMEVAATGGKNNMTPSADADRAMLAQADLLEEMLNATIDSIYSMPVDDDPNLAPGL